MHAMANTFLTTPATRTVSIETIVARNIVIQWRGRRAMRLVALA